jgi:hypothetical protein
MAAGGRNPQKSAAARAKAEKKAAGKKSGGGGAKGKSARQGQGKNIVKCKLCMVEIACSSKNTVKLDEHINSKHPKSSLAECFPTETPEERAKRTAAAAAALQKQPKSMRGKTSKPSKGDLDAMLMEGLSGGKKKKKGKKGGRRG